LSKVSINQKTFSSSAMTNNIRPAIKFKPCNNNYCYTSVQNTCTRLVQIMSRDVHKYTLFISYSTNRSKITLLLPYREISKWFLTGHT